MRMSNFLGFERLSITEMAVTTSRFGIDHPTVVPTNFDPTDEEETGDDTSND